MNDLRTAVLWQRYSSFFDALEHGQSKKATNLLKQVNHCEYEIAQMIYLLNSRKEAGKPTTIQQRGRTIRRIIYNVFLISLGTGAGFGLPHLQKFLRPQEAPSRKTVEDQQEMMPPLRSEYDVPPSGSSSYKMDSRPEPKKQWWEEEPYYDPYRGLYGVYAERFATTWLVQEDGSLKKGVGHGASILFEGEEPYEQFARDLVKQNIVSPGDRVVITTGLDHDKREVVAIDLDGKEETIQHLEEIRKMLQHYLGGSVKVLKGTIVDDKSDQYLLYNMRR